MKAKTLKRYVFSHSHFISSTTRYIICREKTSLPTSSSETYALVFICFISMYWFCYRLMVSVRTKRKIKKTKMKGTTTTTTTTTMLKAKRTLQNPSTKSVQLTRSPKRKPLKDRRKSKPEISERFTSTVYPRKIRLKNPLNIASNLWLDLSTYLSSGSIIASLCTLCYYFPEISISQWSFLGARNTFIIQGTSYAYPSHVPVCYEIYLGKINEIFISCM